MNVTISLLFARQGAFAPAFGILLKFASCVNTIVVDFVFLFLFLCCGFWCFLLCLVEIFFWKYVSENLLLNLEVVTPKF